MRLKRRTAAWLAVAAVALSLGGAAWRVTRPDYIRKHLLAFGREALAEGWHLEVGTVDYSLLDGRATLENLRLLSPGRTEPVASVRRVEAELRFAALFGRARLATEVRIHDPEILLERGENGRLSIESAFRPAGAATGRPAGHPAIVVKGGRLRLRSADALAAGEEVVLALESLDLAESRSGGPARIDGVLAETGSPGSGRGAFGRVRFSGEFPWAKQGLTVSAEQFTVDDALLGRLSQKIRDSLAPFRFTGPFGDGTLPALEVAVRRPVADGPNEVHVTARPRGLSVHLRDFDYPLTGVSGEVSWNGGKGTLAIRRLVLRHGPTEFRAAGEVGLASKSAPFRIEFGASDLILDDELRKAFPEGLRKIWDVYAFRGRVGVKDASFIQRAIEGGRVEVDIAADLLDAGLSYKGHLDAAGVRHGFDWPVDRVTGTVSVKGPSGAEGTTAILLQGVKGKHGDVDVTAEGSVIEWPEHRAKVDIRLEAKEVPLDDSVRNCSPIITRIFETYGAAGVLSNLQVHIVQDDLPRAPTLVAVIGEFDGKGSVLWERMPLPVEGVSGTVAYRERLLDGRRAHIVEISGIRGSTPGGATVFGDGTVEWGEGRKEEDLHLRVRAETVLLDGELEDAIRKGDVKDAVRLWNDLRPSGPADVSVDVSGPSSRPRQSFTATLRGAYLEGWGEVRFPVADLTGTVVATTDSLVLRNVRGIHGGREVTLGGEVKDLSGKALLDLSLRTTAFPLDESAKAILGPALTEKIRGYFDTVRPAPGLAGDATVRLVGPASSLGVEVTLENVRGGSAAFDLRGLAFTGGKVRYADGALAIEDLRGTVGEDRELRIATGSLDLDRGQGSLTVEARGLRFPADLAGLIPADTAAAIEEAVPGRFLHFDGMRVSLAEGWRKIVMDGTASLSPPREGATGGLGLEGVFRLDGFTLHRGEEEGSPTEVRGAVEFARGALDAGVRIREFEGRLDLDGSIGDLGQGVRATLSGATGRVEGRDLRDAGGDLLLLPGGVFLVKSLRGNLSGGEVGVSLEVGGRHLFEGIVTLRNARAREFFTAADPASTVEGQVEATLRFHKPRSSQPLLVGNGRVDIKNGRLFQVPVFRGIFNLLRISDPPEFTAGRLVFTMSGDKLSFSEVDLQSSVVGIRQAPGRSAAYIDGRLDLKLLPEIKTEGILWLPINVVSTLTQPFLERIYTIYVRGTIQKPEVSFQVLPGLFAGDLRDGPVFQPPPPAFPVDRRPPWDF